ncbi:MAG: Uma2 family endonuclease [Myxococcota bacterium]
MAGLAEKKRPMTFAEAAELDPDEAPGELDGGEWVQMTRNTWLHGKILINVGFVLKRYTHEHPEWSVSGGDPGTKLGQNPDILRGPDVGVVRREREPSGKGQAGWLEGAPDLAVEVSGDQQSASDLARKALEYLGAGAQMVWVIDPEPKRVMVYTPPSNIQVLGEDDTLDATDVLPGFSCRVGELFD